MRGVRRTSVDVVTRGLAALRHGAGAAARYGRRGLAEDVFASSPVALAFLDTRLRFCRVNEAFAAMTGVSVPAHVGRTPMDLVPGIDPRQYLPHLRAVLAGTPPPAALTITSDPRGSDRATRSWTVTFHPVRVSGGRVRGVGVAAVDVTEQTAAEEARRREEATARLVLESAPNGMLLVDAGGSIVAVNPEAERLFGYAAAELVGRSVEVLVPERSRAAHPRLRAGFVADPRTRPMGRGVNPLKP